MIIKFVIPNTNLRKGVFFWSQTAEILMDWGTIITPVFHSNAHLNILKAIFSDKPLIIAEIYEF